MKRKPNGYWTKELCHIEALKYANKTDFQKNSGGAYDYAKRQKWIDDICSHIIKPEPKWSKELCYIEALKHTNKTDFKNNSGGAYDYAQRRKWIDDICGHMVRPKHKSKWSKELCHIEALKYKTRTEFKKNNLGAYGYAQRNIFLNDICTHMKYLQKPSGYWTKEKCKEETLKYNTKIELIENNGSVYKILRDNGWLDELCSHFVLPHIPITHYTYEYCKKEALKYKTRTELIKTNYTLFRAATQNGWYNDICSHMGKSIKVKYVIYAYEFSDNNVYVGITKNSKLRFWTHKNRYNSPVYIHSHKHNLKPNQVILYEQLVYNENEIIELEDKWINEYKNNGWKLLNKARAGALGGNIIKWTYKKCKKEALKYESRSEFQKKSPGAYNSARNKGWRDDICSHMISTKKPNGYWNIKDNCKIEALKYTTITDFQRRSTSAYHGILKNDWSLELLSHMTSTHHPHGYWTKEHCREEALKFKLRSKFARNSKGAYASANKNGWYDDITSHMVSPYKPYGYWTKEKCHEEALKYNSKKEFKNKYYSAYSTANKKGWTNEICSHMKEGQKPNGYWTKELCHIEALKYKHRTNFKLSNGSAYSTANKKGWLDDICTHMSKPTQYNFKWTFDACKEEALKYKTKKDFQNNNPSAFTISHKKGWINEICSHMKELRKPNGYWTYEKCKEEASKHKRKIEFIINCSGAYNKARTNNWLNEFFPKK